MQIPCWAIRGLAASATGWIPPPRIFPASAASWQDQLAGHRGLQRLAQPVVETLSRQVANLQSSSDPFRPNGLVLHTLGDTQALQRPSAWRWLQ